MRELNSRMYGKEHTNTNSEKYKKKAEKILKTKAPLHCRIPHSWAEEVYKLLKVWEDQFGIVHTQRETYDSFNNERYIYNFLVELRNIIKHPNSKGMRYAFIKQLKSSTTIIYRKTFGKIIDHYKKPILHITQLKEKYGRLVIYYKIEGKGVCGNGSVFESIVKYDIDTVREVLQSKGVHE